MSETGRGFLPSTDVAALLSAATADKEKASLASMLQRIAHSFDADACVLWEVKQLEVLDHPVSPNSELFVVASWLRENRMFALHRLKVGSSLTGSALLAKSTLKSDDIKRDPRIRDIDPLFDLMGFKSMLTSPITFTDGKLGGINLYRHEDSPVFSESDAFRLEDWARIIAGLYQAIRTRLSLELLMRIDEILMEGDLPARDKALGINDTLDRVCQIVGQAFHSLEVSIFLENPFIQPGKYSLLATTWDKQILNATKQKSPNTGATCWVLTNEKPIIIFDWADFSTDFPAYARLFPGLNWEDSLNILDAARAKLSLRTADRPPPLSFMATPIRIGKEMMGVIRCTGGNFGSNMTGPFYFDHRDLALLGSVSFQIGRYWGNCIGRHKIVAEEEFWQARTFEDLAHQQRGPLIQLQRHLARLLGEPGRKNRDLLAVRGLSRKLRRVTTNTRVLAALNKGKPNTLRLRPLKLELLTLLLIELAEDNRLMVDPSKHIQFSVDTKSIESIKEIELSRIHVDYGLLEQVLNNILDNAGKYSYSDTTVNITAGLTTDGELFISVMNVGIPLSATDVVQCVQRGWRTPTAETVTGEGSGIGLWIVDQFMRLQGGRLAITSTNSDDTTEVRLLFPIKRG
jgi:GAF domain-containing protein